VKYVNTVWLDGMCFAVLKSMVVLVFKTSRLRIGPYLVMVVQATNLRWHLANTPKEEVYWLKGVIPGLLEAWGFAFLGRPYGNKEILLSIWNFLY
jgi:hypothetical protein